MNWYALFLTLAGAIFVGVLMIVATSVDRLLLIVPALLGAYVIAWLAGLLTPGPPAGAGVREVVLYGLLHSVEDAPILLPQ